MSTQNIKLKSLLKTLGLAIAFGTIVGSLVPVNARPSSELKKQDSVTITNSGLPSHRRDGGTRSNCSLNSEEFVALLPNTAVSRTASSNPKLYFHVPPTKRSQTIEFVLRDSQDRLVYETFIETKGQTGIMSIEIPLPVVTLNQTKSLGYNTNYHWYLSHICNPKKRSQDLVLQGWINHVALSKITQEKLKQLSLDEQINFYQQQGIWHDAIAIAASQRQAQPENSSQTKWSEFLSQIGLEKFVAKPLIEQN